MMDLLLDPNGRLARNRFWQGMVVLTVINVLIVATTSYISLVYIFALFLLIYPYICVIGKRLHDLGFSAWWVLAVFAGQFVFQNLLNAVITPIFVPMDELADIMREIQERMKAEETEAAMEGLHVQFKMLLPVSLIDVVATNALIGGILGYMTSDPEANRFGPPTSD
ncbi:MAG: DUF805 domain-containing protein [Pseudomonadota bacterium]